ncbi:MAG: PD40 domain-containing protein [Deltaproteobacteria bacterium]|nr:PD40 domain-containing protein [Deltaproteobacteria bacterium]
MPPADLTSFPHPEDPLLERTGTFLAASALLRREPRKVQDKVLLTIALGATLAVACKGVAPTAAPPKMVAPAASSAPAQVAARPTAPSLPPEHWYFEWLSQDGKRALLRRLDGNAPSTLQTRVVDVDSGNTIAEETFPELARTPHVTAGRDESEFSELDRIFAATAFGDDLVRGARIAGAFPFGSCGRFSAAPAGTAIAFNAGDWIYLADKAGHVKKRLTSDAAYDPRFTPDGKFILFRRISGMIEGARARYELHVVPSDLSTPARPLAGTQGARDRFVVDAAGKNAIAVASQEPYAKTCVLSIALKPPFAVKKLACLEGSEPLTESVLSPTGKWAAITTRGHSAQTWRVRVLSLADGKVVRDEHAEPGMVVRAVSDAGLVVSSGVLGTVVDDVANDKRRALETDLELGHRGFFRSATELVVVRGGTTNVLDLAKL